MRRTNIYLSEEEHQALDARAAVEGCSRSDLVRAVIDREMNLDQDDAIDTLLGDLANELADVARTTSAKDSDLRSEL